MGKKSELVRDYQNQVEEMWREHEAEQIRFQEAEKKFWEALKVADENTSSEDSREEMEVFEAQRSRKAKRARRREAEEKAKSKSEKLAKEAKYALVARLDEADKGDRWKYYANMDTNPKTKEDKVKERYVVGEVSNAYMDAVIQVKGHKYGRVYYRKSKVARAVRLMKKLPD